MTSVLTRLRRPSRELDEVHEEVAAGELTETRPAQSWEFEPGDSIAPGLVAIGALGGGDRYEVYQAIDEQRLAVVVAKLVRPHLVEDERVVRDLAVEAEMLASLAHPGIPRLLDAFVDDERPHLLLEQIEGPTLHRVVRRNGLSTEQIAPLALHLCSVLHYLAMKGVVHLDVKPTNVVMAAPPRLIDLSIARHLEGPNPPRAGLGTRLYMAPEQCVGEGFGPIGTAADIWGLGVTLYEATVGRRPFRNEEVNPDSWAVPPVHHDRPPQVRSSPAALPEWVHDVLSDVITSCLRWDPSERPTAYEIALALEPLVADVTRTPRLWGRRRRSAIR